MYSSVSSPRISLVWQTVNEIRSTRMLRSSWGHVLKPSSSYVMKVCVQNIRCTKLNVIQNINSGVSFLLVCAAEKKVTSAQIKEHRGVVLDLIGSYLKGKDVKELWLTNTMSVSFCVFHFSCPCPGVCKLYSEQRAIRVKRMVDKKRLWAFSIFQS